MSEIQLYEPPNGLPEFKSTDWDEHVEVWRGLDDHINEQRWRMAAVAASLTACWGERGKVLSRFAHEAGTSARRVYEYAATYRAFEVRERSQILSFHHHTLAARDEEPETVIDQAEIEELSTRDTAERVRERRQIAEGRPEPVTQPMRTCPTCDGDGEIPVEPLEPAEET